MGIDESILGVNDPPLQLETTSVIQMVRPMFHYKERCNTYRDYSPPVKARLPRLTSGTKVSQCPTKNFANKLIYLQTYTHPPCSRCFSDQYSHFTAAYRKDKERLSIDLWIRSNAIGRHEVPSLPNPPRRRIYHVHVPAGIYIPSVWREYTGHATGHRAR